MTEACCLISSLPPHPPAGTVTGQDVQDFIISGGNCTALPTDADDVTFNKKNTDNVEGGTEERRVRGASMQSKGGRLA